MRAFIQFLSIKLPPSRSLLRSRKVFYWLKLVFMLFFWKSKAQSSFAMRFKLLLLQFGAIKVKKDVKQYHERQRDDGKSEREGERNNIVCMTLNDPKWFSSIRLLLCNFLTSWLQLRLKSDFGLTTGNYNIWLIIFKLCCWFLVPQ